jgi:hypothetical protein
VPAPTSYADLITHWTQLLEAANRSPEMKVGIEDERTALESVLAEVIALKARQDELTAFKQETTQNLVGAVKRGKDIALRFRSIARAKVGPHNERMVLFNVAPIRKRGRRPVVEEPTDGGTPGAELSVPPDVMPAV